jgi:hypothetical protein
VHTARSSSFGSAITSPTVRAATLTEDTFVLLDALEADADAIRDLAPRICLEIGRVEFPAACMNRVRLDKRFVDTLRAFFASL